MGNTLPESDQTLALLLAEAVVKQKELAEAHERIEAVQEKLSHAQRRAEASARTLMVGMERLLRDWRVARRLAQP